MQNCEHIFLGAVGKNGFTSLFAQLLERDSPYTLFIIKGSAGNGKSTLMKKLSAELTRAGCSVTEVHCSSDADSLDGLLCREKRFAIVDGTAPHVLEPAYLCGKHRVVSLYRYLNVDKLLPYCELIVGKLERNARQHDSVRALLGSAGALEEQLVSGANSCIDAARLEKYFGSLAKRTIVGKGRGKARVEKVFFSAVTNRGVKNRFEQNKDCYLHRFIIDDRWLAAGSRGLSLLAHYAVQRGFEVRLGLSPLLPDTLLEYLAIPELSLLFAVNGFLNSCRDEDAKLISAYRFYDAKKLSPIRGRLNFCKRCCLSQVESAAEELADAKRLHDEIESYFKVAVDFDAQRQEYFALLRQLGLPCEE